MESLHAVVTHNILAMHAEPGGSSELVSQAILGDSVTLLEECGDYRRLRTVDDYEGWALRRHLCIATPALFSARPPLDGRQVRVRVAATDLLQKPVANGPIQTRLVLGSRLIAQKPCGDLLRVLYPVTDLSGASWRAGYVPAEAVASASERLPLRGDALLELAKRFIGTPYLWGGTTPFGFDCSGFVQRLYAMAGVLLPRDAYLQARSPLGRLLAENESPQPRDLVFFQGQRDPRNRGVTHVGMALGRNRFIHAYGRDGVTIHTLDDPEIRTVYTYRGAWRCRPVASGAADPSCPAPFETLRASRTS